MAESCLDGDTTNPKPYNYLKPSRVKICPSSHTLKNPGEKLRQLLLEHGSFDKIEGHLERWHEEKKKSKEMGGNVTKEWLMKERHYTQCSRCTESWQDCVLLFMNPPFPPPPQSSSAAEEDGRRGLRMGTGPRQDLQE